MIRLPVHLRNALSIYLRAVVLSATSNRFAQIHVRGLSTNAVDETTTSVFVVLLELCFFLSVLNPLLSYTLGTLFLKRRSSRLHLGETFLYALLRLFLDSLWGRARPIWTLFRGRRWRVSRPVWALFLCATTGLVE
jgi:hypothetical protein